jgi:DNA repair protein RadC
MMPDHERAVIEAALAILRARMRAQGARAGSPSAARELALLHMANLEAEHFAVMFLDAQQCLITFEEMFKGTLTQTSVYPREVVRAALRHNANSVILVHNHPSCNPEPSRADEILTRGLKESLALVDVRVDDHLIVAGDRVTSFAERGML